MTCSGSATRHALQMLGVSSTLHRDLRGGTLDLGEAQGAPVSAGVCEIWASAPVEFDYDNDCAVCYMLEGSVTLTEGDTRIDFEPGDVVLVPQQAGLNVSWDTSSYGRFFYVTYPQWR